MSEVSGCMCQGDAFRLRQRPKTIDLETIGYLVGYEASNISRMQTTRYHIVYNFIPLAFRVRFVRVYSSVHAAAPEFLVDAVSCWP